MPNENGEMRRATVSSGERPDCPSSEGKEYYPPKREMLKQHEIHINFFDVGCMVRVGCKNVAFSTVEEAMKELNEYVNDPRKSIEKWNKIFNANE